MREAFTLSKRSVLIWLLLGLVAAPPLLAAQQWIEPYPQTLFSIPGVYLEFVDRMSISAFAVLSTSVQPGKTVLMAATFGDRIVETDPGLRSLVGPTTTMRRIQYLYELRLVGYDAAGLSLEFSTANVSDAFAECAVKMMGVNAMMTISKYFAAVNCSSATSDPLAKAQWQQVRLPLKAVYVVTLSRGIELPLALTIENGTLHPSLSPH